jgi:hypothetical protein
MNMPQLKFYGISVATMRRWRWLRAGPKFYKLGASVRYRLADLEAYLHRTPTGGEQSDQPAVSNVGHGVPTGGKRADARR